MAWSISEYYIKYRIAKWKHLHNFLKQLLQFAFAFYSHVGLLKAVKENVSIPVFVMIRPRGGDFCFNDFEMMVMKEDVKIMKLAGADGFVFGIMNRWWPLVFSRSICLINKIKN